MQIAAIGPADNVRSFQANATLKKQRIVVPPWVFILSWFAILFLHLVCGIFIGALGALHEFTASPQVFAYSSAALQIPRSNLVVAARTFYVVTCLHMLAISRMLYYSIQRKQFSFHGGGGGMSSQANSPSRRRSHKIFHTVLAPFFWIWSKYFGIDGLFGLNGPYFDVAFCAREVLEAFSQAYQAYFFSSLLTTHWINRVAVAIIIAGSVGTPLIHFVWYRNDSLRRYMSLLLDMVLDLGGSVFIPAVICYELTSQFDWQNLIFPPAITYDNVWRMNETAQARLLYVWSTLDYLSTLMLQLSVLGGLVTISTGLERTDDCRIGNTRNVQFRQERRRTSSLKLVHGNVQKRSKARRWLENTKNILFACWGIVALYADTRSLRIVTEELIPSCMLGTHAWMARKPGCSVLWVNCYRLGIAGAPEEVTPILDQIQRSSLTLLGVMHCPAFTMPDIIQEFHQRRSIELTNVTLVGWPMSAAIHSKYHGDLSHIVLGYVNVTEFPPGLMHAHVPLALTNFFMSHTNLTVIPPSIGEYWSNRRWIILQFEHTSLTTLPESFGRLRIRRLSLIGNSISNIPDDLFANQTLTELGLSGNPLLQLPASIGDTSSLSHVIAEHTLITAPTEWLIEWVSRKAVKPTGSLQMFGSPICEVASSAEWQTRACLVDAETCQGSYPWELVWPLRPL